MGLFKKRDQTKEELETMRTELRTLRERLEQTDAVKDRLAERLGRLDADTERLNSQVGSVEHRVGEVAGSIAPAIDHAVRFVSEQTPNAADVEGLRTDIVRLGDLTGKVEALDAQVARQASTPPPPPPPIDTTAVDALEARLTELTESLEQQRTQIADLAVVAIDAAERTDHTEQRLTTIADERADTAAATASARAASDTDSPTTADVERLNDQVAALESRVQQVSLELTNQLTELSGDVDRVTTPDDTHELIERVTAQLDGLTGGQERLANEQARFAIQFRDDLAELADRLRRQR
ncbi:MAG: hypothetical protein AB8G14_06815 [Ilumatobacter sp.]